jgi:LacI family transcriptional regulator
MNRNSPNLKDLALAAEVSIATASVVINNKAGKQIRVSKETQARIWEAAKKIGYVGNPAARSLAGGRNNIIGIFSYESIFPTEQYEFYHQMLLGIEKEAEANNLDLLLVTYRGSKKDSRQKRIHRLRFADGAILLGLEQDEKEIAELVESGYKIVVIGKRDFQGITISYVAPDYLNATKKLTQFVYDLGHRHIAYIQWSSNKVPSLEREIGFRTAVNSLDIKSVIHQYPEKHIDEQAIESCIRSGITCFIVERFISAELLYKKIKSMGLSVPKNVSICVLGGPGNEIVTPLDWTTIKIPGLQLGSVATNILVQLLNQSDAQPICQILDCEIHPGKTLGPVPNL